MIVYQGPSQLTGAPIAAIATGIDTPSRNPKTGPMIQVWILRTDTPPHTATRTGQDRAVCGDCPLSHYKQGACYVRPADAPLSVFRAYHRGAYQRQPRSRLHLAVQGRTIRLGAYGDPAAVPVAVWRSLLPLTTGHTGYTHQWRTTPELRPYVMASVETERDAREAQAQGWRTFRVRTHADKLADNEIPCPAAEESGHRTTCDRCLLCDGARSRAPSITIQAHGARARRLQ